MGHAVDVDRVLPVDPSLPVTVAEIFAGSVGTAPLLSSIMVLLKWRMAWSLSVAMASLSPDRASSFWTFLSLLSLTMATG